MLSFPLTDVESWKCTLHGEYIRAGLELFVHTHSSSGFFWFLHPESARSEVEELAELWKDQWEDSAFLWLSCIVAAVHEDILFPRVAM